MIKIMAYIPVLLLVSTQLTAAQTENTPPIEVDAFVVNDKANAVPVEVIPNVRENYFWAEQIHIDGGISNGFV